MVYKEEYTVIEALCVTVTCRVDVLLHEPFDVVSVTVYDVELHNVAMLTEEPVEEPEILAPVPLTDQL